jgi:hypothetical protein
LTQNESSNVVIRWFSSLPAMFRKAAARRAASKAKVDDDMEWMEAVLRAMGGAPTGEWQAQMEAIRRWARSTFHLKLVEFKKRHPELAGGRWQDDPYWLPTQPTEAMAARVAVVVRRLAPDQSGHIAMEREISLDQPAEVQGSPAMSNETADAELVRLLRQLG